MKKSNTLIDRMRKLILPIFLIFTSTILAQNSWSYKSGGNDFDGKYKVAYVQGIGDDYPYKKPYLFINKFDNNKDINFYLSKAGFYNVRTGAGILIKLDSEPDVIYTTYSHSFSNDGDSVFLESFVIDSEYRMEDNVIGQLEFISKLKTASKVSIRIKNEYGQNDMTFSLNGSSRAIEYVIPNLNDLISQIQTKKLENSKLLNQRNLLYERLVNDCVEQGLTILSIEQLEGRFKQDLGLGYYEALATREPYDSISVMADFESSRFQDYGYVDVSYVMTDGSQKGIIGTFEVKPDSPLMMEYLEEVKRKEQEEIRRQELLELERNRIYGLLDKYGREDIKQFILKSILEEVDKDSFSLQEIDSIGAIFSRFIGGDVGNLKILLSLKENKEFQIVTLPRMEGVYISKRDLKMLGAKIDVPF